MLINRLLWCNWILLCNLRFNQTMTSQTSILTSILIRRVSQQTTTCVDHPWTGLVGRSRYHMGLDVVRREVDWRVAQQTAAHCIVDSV